MEGNAPVRHNPCCRPQDKALTMTDLATLNAADPAGCRAMLESVVERAPWVLADVPAARPFADADAVADAIETAIRSLDHGARLRLLNGHPELAGAEAVAGAMTRESTDEQARLRLTALSSADLARLRRLNAAYRARFGHPYVVALHDQPDLAAVFANIERRLRLPPETEIEIALAEVASVMRARVSALLAPPVPDPSSPDLASTSAQ